MPSARAVAQAAAGAHARSIQDQTARRQHELCGRSNQPRAQIGQPVQRVQAMRPLRHVRHQAALEESITQARKLLEQRNPKLCLEPATEQQHASADGDVEQEKSAQEENQHGHRAEPVRDSAHDVAELEKTAEQQSLHEHTASAEKRRPDQ